MFGKFMNNYYYGKSGKGDYTPEDLPKTRWQLFWEMLRVRFNGLCRMNLIYMLPWIPTMLVIGMFVVTAVKGIGEWNKNNNSPRLIVPAVIVAKRTNVHRSGGEHHHTTTTYYVTFEVESGDRMELRMDGDEYGLLAEGDQGLLTFQGTRFLSFERT